MLQTTKLTYTVDDLPRLYASGILQADDRVELMDGEIYYMSPINFSHAQCVRKFNDVLHEYIHKEYYIDTQNPLTLDKVNILQPDVAIYSRADFLQLTQHPTAPMVRLLIEVADTTYLQDKQMKLPRYAQAGILHVWIVNLREKTVEVFQSPRNNQYLSTTRYLTDQSVPTPFGFSLEVSRFL